MAPTCEIATLEPRPTAAIRMKVRPGELGNVFAQLWPEIFGWLAARGQAPAGAPYARYHAFGADEIDVEAGMPVAEAITAEGRIFAADLPGGEVVRTVHIGPFDRVAEAHARIEAWLNEAGRQPSGPPWEAYVTDPQQQPDPAKWETEVIYPLA